MKGIEFIEKFGGISDDMIYHARLHKRHCPLWLRITSAAAASVCIVLLTAVLLTRILGGTVKISADPNQPDVMSPGVDDSTAEAYQDKDSVALEEVFHVEIKNPVDDTVLFVPEAYADEFFMEYDYAYYEQTTDETFHFEDAIFYFFDLMQKTQGKDGLVWMIESVPVDSTDIDQIIKNDKEYGDLYFVVNYHILGTKNNRIYYVVCLETSVLKYNDKSNKTFYDSERCELDDAEALRSYLNHMEVGIRVLEYYVEKNDIQPIDGATDWEAWYQENMIGRLPTVVPSQIPESSDSLFLDNTNDGWLCGAIDPNTGETYTLWLVYQVPLDVYSEWTESHYPQWEDAPLLSQVYELGMDDEYVFFMDAPTSVAYLSGDSQAKSFYFQAQCDGKLLLEDLVEKLNITENPNWQSMYANEYLIDVAIEAENAYSTVTDPAKGLQYQLPVDRRNSYRFTATTGEDNKTCLVKIGAFESSQVAVSTGGVAQWTIKRVLHSEIENEKQFATFVCVLGHDNDYTYYLALSTGLRWLENSEYSKTNYISAMQEGENIIASFMALNGITPEDIWLTQYQAEFINEYS